MTSALRPAVFLDRDGVLNRTLVRDGVTHPPSSLEELELLPGVVDACQRLHEAGLPLVVVTNQPDVARGTQTRAGVEALNDVFRRLLPVVEVLSCFHDGADGCACRKPRPGMLLEAAQRWGLDLKRSFIVGDRWSDVQAGQTVGCQAVLIVTPYSGADRCRPEHQAADLTQAARWILHHTSRG